MVLNALGWEPSTAWGQDAQGDISGKTPAVDRIALPLELPVVPELLEGTMAQMWEHIQDLTSQAPSLYRHRREHVVEHIKRKKKLLKAQMVLKLHKCEIKCSFHT